MKWISNICKIMSILQYFEDNDQTLQIKFRSPYFSGSTGLGRGVEFFFHQKFKTQSCSAFLFFLTFSYHLNCINQNLRRSTVSMARKRERNLARISFLIVTIFIICHSVKNIPTVFEIFGKNPRVSRVVLSWVLSLSAKRHLIMARTIEMEFIFENKKGNESLNLIFQIMSNH